MTDFQSAIDTLKVKLAAAASKTATFGQETSEASVALANFTDSTVLHASVNWDPQDHPRNPNTGEFAKTVTGFIWGKAKKAKFPNSNIGDIDLAPGDTLYKTQAGNALIAHADGTFTYKAVKGVQKGKISHPTADSVSVQAALDGSATKVASNPGVTLSTASESKAKAMLEHPDQFKVLDNGTVHAVTNTEPLGKPSSYEEIPFKPGKDSYTAKQIADYQNSHAAVPIGTDSEGNKVASGGWVDFGGKPYQVHASPYGAPHVVAYKWVSTKQQASNLPNHTVLSFGFLKNAKKISDPTGKPYGAQATHPNSLDAQNTAKAPVTHGSLMSQAVTGKIPNASVEHKKALDEAKGAFIGVTDGTGIALDKNNMAIKSGDWLEIEGKPVQVHASPNENNVAISKWVITKQQASSNTYDFPHTVTKQGTLIEDPTGNDYKTLAKVAEDKAFKADLKAKLDAAPIGSTYEGEASGNKLGPFEKVPSLFEGPAPEKGIWVDQSTLDQPPAESETLANIMISGDSITITPPAEATPLQALYNAPEGSTLSYTFEGEDFQFYKYNGEWISNDGAAYSSESVVPDLVKVDGKNNWSIPSKVLKHEPVNLETFGLLDVAVFKAKPGDVLKIHSMKFTFKGSKWYSDSQAYTPIEWMDLLSSANENMWKNSEEKHGLAPGDVTYIPMPDEAPLADWEKELLYESTASDGPTLENLLNSPEGTLVYSTVEDISTAFNKQDNETWISPAGLVVSSFAMGNQNPKTLSWEKPEPLSKDMNTLAHNFLKDLNSGKLSVPDVQAVMNHGVEPESIGAIHALEAWNLYTSQSANQIQVLADEGNISAQMAEALFYGKPSDVPDTAVAEPEMKNVFVHPVSGVSFDLQPGAKVYKHKSTPNTWVVENASGANPINFFNQYGKQYKPKAAQKNLDHAYALDKDWPGAKATEKVEDKPEADIEPKDTASWTKKFEGAPAGSSIIETSTNKDKNHTGDVNTFIKQDDGLWHYANGSTTLASAGFAKIFSTKNDYYNYAFSEISPENTMMYDASDLQKQVASAPAGSVLTEVDSANGLPVIAYVKKESGDWEDPYGTLYSPETAALLVDSMEKDATGTHGELSIGGPPAPAPEIKVKDTQAEVSEFDLAGQLLAAPPGSVPKKPKAIKKGDLQKSYTLGDTTINLHPGETMVYLPGDQIYMVTTPGSGYSNPNMSYAADGSSTINPYYLNTLTPAGVKKQMKSQGGQVVADYPMTKTVMTEYEPDEITEHTYYGVLSYVSDVRNDLLSKVPVSYVGHVLPYKEFDGTPWSQLSNEAKAKIFADTYIEIPGKAVATLSSTSSWTLEKSEKAYVTKQRSALLIAYRAGLLAAALSDSDSNWTDDKYAEELAFLAQKADKPGTSLGSYFKSTIPVNSFLGILTKANNERLFKKTLNDLDFDPYNGTAEEYAKYAHGHDVDYLSALDLEDQKNWVLLKLGSPTLKSQSGLEASLNTKILQAKTKVEVASLAASLTKSVPDPKVQLPSVKGVYMKSTLASSYSWTPEGGTLVSLIHIGPDAWHLDSAGEVIETTDAVVSVMVNSALENGSDIQSSDTKAYGDLTPAQQLQKLESSLPGPLVSLSLSALEEAISERGGQHSTSMSASQNRQWLRAYAVGDQIGMAWLESGAVGYPESEYHAGSWSNSSGKMAYRALAQEVSAQSWGSAWLGGGVSDLNNVETANFGNWVTANYGYSANSFVESHDRARLQEILGEPLATGSLTKPADVSDDAWNIVAHATPETDFTALFKGEPVANLSEEQVDTHLTSSSAAQQQGLSSVMLGAVPLYIKRLAVWASTDTLDPEHTSILRAISLKTKHGDYLTETTPVWISPKGEKFPLAPGSVVYKSHTAESGVNYNEHFYVLLEPGTSWPRKGWRWYPNQTKMQSVNFHSEDDLSSFDQVFTMPGTLSWEQAKKDHPEFDKSFWQIASQIDLGKGAFSSYPETGPVLTATLKKNAMLEKEFPNLYIQHVVLPEHIRQSIANLLQQDNPKPLLAVMDYKASKGFYAGMQSKGLLDANQPWLPNLSKGQTSESDILTHWSAGAQKAYADFFGVTTGQIPAHLKSLISPETVQPTKILPDFKDLVLTPTGKKLGGAHTKYVYADQDGNEWMAKTFQSDPNAAARIEAETAAINIGLLFNFGVPVANSQKVAGTYAYLQYLKPATKDFTGLGPNDLPLVHVQQAMAHHVLDWVVSNHDTHKQNLMLGKDNKVFGIDLGQAFKHFPNDKLAVGYLPPENPEMVWYDNFYNGVMNGSISKADADEVTKYVLRAAQKISKDKDTEYRALLEEALKSRTFWPDAFPTKEKFIDGLVERKHNVFDDFITLYKGVYKKSPYDFDIDTENLVPPTLDPHTHIAVSQDYADDVKKSALQGKSIFFASADLEDSHILMSTAKDHDGTTMLTGEAKIRKDGDMIISNWLKGQTIEHHAAPVYQYQEQSAPDPVDDYEALPGNQFWISTLIQGSKTVSSHNAGGNTEYNSSTLQSMDNSYIQMTKMKGLLVAWKGENSDKPWDGSVNVGTASVTDSDLPFTPTDTHMFTMEQQNAYEAMLDQYLDYYQKVVDAKGSTIKVTPHFKQITYTATPAAIKEFEASQASVKVEDFKDAPLGSHFFVDPSYEGNVSYTKTAPGKWTSDGDGTVATTASLMKMWKGTKTTWAIEPPETVDHSEDTETTVKVGTKVLKVVYRAAASPNGTLNIKTGQLEMQQGETKQFQTGHMYEIDFGNTVIEYRPWGAADGVALAQQGHLRFRKKDWKGDADAIDEIFDVLRHMGLDLDPADEESMELFYWKHTYNIMQNRKGGKSTGLKVKNSLEAAIAAHPSMSRSEELEAYRAAWATILGDDVVKNADWMPKFSRLRPESLMGGANSEDFTSGRPYWYRSDFTWADLKKTMSYPPSSHLTNKSDSLKIALSGAALSTEERARYYGSMAQSGMSSGQDQTLGSSAVIYTSQNYSFDNSSQRVWYHPKVVRRTSNYAYTGDHYGKIEDQADHSPWKMGTSASIEGGELMVKNALSVMDDILSLKFNSVVERDQAIKHYKDLGITEIHGFPIEDVFVTTLNPSKMQKMYEKVWQDILDAEKEEAAKKS